MTSEGEQLLGGESQQSVPANRVSGGSGCDPGTPNRPQPPEEPPRVHPADASRTKHASGPGATVRPERCQRENPTTAPTPGESSRPEDAAAAPADPGACDPPHPAHVPVREAWPARWVSRPPTWDRRGATWLPSSPVPRRVLLEAFFCTEALCALPSPLLVAHGVAVGHAPHFLAVLPQPPALVL